MKKKLRIYALGISAVLLSAGILLAQQKIWTMTGNGARRNTVEYQIQTTTVGSAADLVPGTDNTNSLGTSSLAWDDIQTEDLTVQDDLTVTGLATIGETLSVTGVTSISSLTATNQILVGSAGSYSTFTATELTLDSGQTLTNNGTSALVGNTTVTGTLGVTGATTVSTITVSGLITLRGDSDPNTNVTPTAVGQLLFDTNDLYICYSTAATSNSWVISFDTATKCAG